MTTADPVTFIPAPVSEVGAEIGRNVTADLLAALPEILRRSRLGCYMDDGAVVRETGLTKRQLRHLRATRQIPFTKRGKTIRYKTEDVFAYMDAGHIPARPLAP